MVPGGDVRLPAVSSTFANSLSAAQLRGDRARAWLQSTRAELWAKFLLALTGLSLAFGAALFSTASGEAGHLWASVILASVALLLAGFVGLVTVPYLARRAALERLRQKFHYDVTKAGAAYAMVTLIIGIAALNTGNNLLYIVVAAMLAAILVSGVFSALVLRGLELDVRLPEHVFAGRPVMGHVVLRNQRNFLPSFSISVVPTRQRKKITRQWRWEPTTFAFPLNRSPQDQWFRLRDWSVRRVRVMPEPPGIFEGMVYFPYLPPKCELPADLELSFRQRGRYSESSFGVATRFPFAFLTRTRQIALRREILVYPRIDALGEMFDVLPRVRGEWESFVRGRGSDLYRIREYLPEDSARHVDWKATAKSGSLKVREFTREDERKLRIVFDNPSAGTISDQAYERAVNLAASVSWFFSTHPAQLTFLVPGNDACSDVNQFLAQLAVILPQPSPLHRDRTRPDPLRELRLGGSDEYNIILTARSRQSLPASWWDCSYFLFLEP
jgi:uncharacterized protein (DUF58 family)